MMPHLAQFAVRIHNIYRDSLVQILDKAVNTWLLGSEKNLDLFEAFSVSAFFKLHEASEDFSKKYGTTHLSDLLGSKPLVTQNILSKTEESVLPNQSDDFQTSWLTGDTKLSDKEIYTIAINQPKVKFLHYHYNLFFLNNTADKFEKEDICDYAISRNKFFIDVEYDFMDGSKKTYRHHTNYSKQMNFKHDSEMLETAKVILEKDYKFTLPKLPSMDEKDGNVFQECYQNIRQGMIHINSIWEKCAQYLSESKSSPFSQSISDTFKMKYQEALEDLEKHFPSFLGKVQDFIDEAQKDPK